MKSSVLIPKLILLDFLRSTSTRHNCVLEAILLLFLVGFFFLNLFYFISDRSSTVFIYVLLMNVLLVTRLLKSFRRRIGSNARGILFMNEFICN